MAEKKEKRYVSDDAQLMSEWDLERNGDVLPSETSLWSHRKIWWKCERGHYWDATPHRRSYGTGCPYSSGKREKAGYNDLATLFPEIGLEWNSEKNGDLQANAVSPSSNKRVNKIRIFNVPNINSRPVSVGREIFLLSWTAVPSW